MKSIEVRKLLMEIGKEQDELIDYVNQYDQLQRRKEKIVEMCEHGNAYERGKSVDDHEGRVYVELRCEDCGKIWEERMGRGNKSIRK